MHPRRLPGWDAIAATCGASVTGSTPTTAPALRSRTGVRRETVVSRRNTLVVHPPRPDRAPRCCQDGIFVLDERRRSPTRDTWVCNFCSGLHDRSPDRLIVDRNHRTRPEQADAEWRVVLSGKLHREALQRARADRKLALAKGYREAHRADPADGLRIMEEGYSAEQAARHALDRDAPPTWGMTRDFNGKVPDVGNYFVRSTGASGQHLLLHRPGPKGEDPYGTIDPEGIYILAIGEGRHWRLVGWSSAEHALRFASWAPINPERPCWWCHSRNLFPMAQLPSDEEAAVAFAGDFG